MSLFAFLHTRYRWKLFPLRLLFPILIVFSMGLVMLFSAADGHIYPWAFKQFCRFVAGLGLLFMVSFVDIRFWLHHAYWIYGLSFLLLLVVELLGFVGMGAQRWVDLYAFQIQPSELMKIALVLVFARYLHDQSSQRFQTFSFPFIPLCLMLIPALLVLRQPDLGTAVILILIGGTLLFVAGTSLWFFFISAVGCFSILPFLWTFLRDYQKKRVLMFLNPEQDPLGAGYHIIQSKIALGSGGFWGKGFLKGTQSHLQFLPEKQTDFIFTMLCEEFGWFGGATLLGLYVWILLSAILIALRTTDMFRRLLVIGIISIFFFYVFINVGMVMGLLPVVGIPLPFMSYGGSSLLTMMVGFGLICSVEINQDVRLGL